MRKRLQFTCIHLLKFCQFFVKLIAENHHTGNPLLLVRILIYENIYKFLGVTHGTHGQSTYNYFRLDCFSDAQFSGAFVFWQKEGCDRQVAPLSTICSSHSGSMLFVWSLFPRGKALSPTYRVFPQAPPLQLRIRL